MVYKIDELFSDFDLPHGPGAGVGIFRDGQVLFKKGYGLADLAKQQAVTPTTNFRLASLSKQFTAMAIMILKDQGRLSYSDTLQKFFPQFPDYAKNITVRHLLNNQGGLPDYENLIAPSQTEQVHDQDILELLAREEHLLFTPGERYHYSNGGYILLGLIASKVSGFTFAEFLKLHIFEPLGMMHSVAFEDGISMVVNRAYGYSFKEDRFEQNDQSITSATLGDGGIYSSIDDLLLWERELLQPTLVAPTSLTEAFTAGRLNNGEVTSYGFGWMVSQYKDFSRVGHTGSTVGFRTAIQRYVDQKLTIIVLCNRSKATPWDIAEKIADLYLVEADRL